MDFLNLSEAEPDEVVEQAEEDCKDEEQDSQEDEVGGLGRDRGGRRVALEQLPPIAGQVPAQFSVHGF